MPIPLLVPVAFGAAAFFAGAFTGAQVDDSIDQHPAGANITKAPKPTTILFYGASGLALYWGARKAGLVP
jgi:hypothetical protein